MTKEAYVEKYFRKQEKMKNRQKIMEEIAEIDIQRKKTGQKEC